MRSIVYRLLPLLVQVILAYHIRACPQSTLSICKCVSTTSGLRIECLDQSLDEVIRSIEPESKIDRLSIRNANGIPEISAQAFGALSIRELELTGNNIAKIDDNAFDGTASQIVSLLLANNTLSVMPKLDSMTNLETLDLSGNLISNITDNAFLNTKKIRRLHLRANRICKLGPNALNETKDRLEFLDLSNNCLDEVPAQNLRGAQKLYLLDLSGNRIANVPSLRFMNLPSLVELRMNGNAMEQMHPLAFMNVPNLEQLNLSANKLTSLDTNRFQSFSKLATLDVSGNLLTKLPSNSFQNIANLKQLILDDNLIESVETLAFSSLPSLQIISLQNNGLQRLYRNAFDALPALTSLLFTNNSLDDIGEGTFAGMPALQQLILSQNRLTIITSGSFDSITQLTTLDLADNFINTIGASVFQNLNRLFWLDLSGNRLNGLPKDAFNSKISNLLLQGNPLMCNESIDWLVQYLVANNVRTFLPSQNDVTCAAPPEKRGTLLKDLMLQRANDTFFNSLQNGPASTFNVRPPNFNLSTSETGANILPPLNQPGVNVISQQGGQPRTEDLIKSLPQLAALLGGPGGLDNMDLTKLPPEVIRYVAQGGQIPGVSKEKLQQMTQRYLAQMAAKNGGNAQNTANFAIPSAEVNHAVPIIPSNIQPLVTIPAPVFVSFNNFSSLAPSQIDRLITGVPLPPLNSLSPELIQKVLNGGTIPGLTAEQTETIKRRYMQQMFTSSSDQATTAPFRPIGNIGNIVTDSPPTQSPIQIYSSSPFFNLTDLQNLNIDFSKMPPDVLRDLAAGRTPDFGKIPQDIIRTIMEKRPKLFGEIVNRELRPRITSNGTTDIPSSSVDSIKKKPTYDVNDLDKKADISVLSQESDSQHMTVWTAVALGAIGAVTIIAVAVLCWRRRAGRMQRRASRQTNEDTSDTSKFFEQPIIPLAPEPAPRRSKMKCEDAPTANFGVAATRSNGDGSDNPFFSIDPPSSRGPTSPFNMDQTNRPNGPIFSIDSNRVNNQVFNFDPINRVMAGQQFRNANLPNFQSQQHFQSPPLPNHPPARSAVFDHSTGAWMFVTQNGASGDYHRRLDL